jgi:hypothetical protein
MACGGDTAGGVTLSASRGLKAGARLLTILPMTVNSFSGT